MDGENTFYTIVIGLNRSPFTGSTKFCSNIIDVDVDVKSTSHLWGNICCYIYIQGFFFVKYVTFIISTRYWLHDLHQSRPIPGHGAPTLAAVFAEYEGGPQGLLAGLGSGVPVDGPSAVPQDRWTCMEYFNFAHIWCFLQNDSWEQKQQHLRGTTAELAGDMLPTTNVTEKT